MRDIRLIYKQTCLLNGFIRRLSHLNFLGNVWCFTGCFVSVVFFYVQDEAMDISAFDFLRLLLIDCSDSFSIVLALALQMWYPLVPHKSSKIFAHCYLKNTFSYLS